MKDTTATRLRLERARALMTMGDLAKKIGVAQQTISGWETGRRMPRGEHLKALSLLYGCSTDYLLGLEDTRNHEKAGKNND